MSVQSIFLLQFSLSTVAFLLLARGYLLPWIEKKPFNALLMILIAPHMFRHIGMSFLVPALNAAPMQEIAANNLLTNFAIPAAYGDLVSGLLAMVAMLALSQKWRGALVIVWLFSVIGIADLANALSQITAIKGMGATWFIPTFFVPLLLITHFWIVIKLLKRRSHSSATL